MSSSAIQLTDPGRSELGCRNQDDAGHHVDLLLESHELAALDLWIAMNPDIELSRDKAIRIILTRVILRQC